MAPPLDLTFRMSASTVSELPRTTGEVAVIGRSNVGKSSLLNALARQKGLARTSSTPGRTRLLNVFDHDAGGTFVDLPGYGYAKASAKERAKWRKRLHEYLVGREGLVLVLVLVDGEVGPTSLDKEMLAFLREHDVPFRVVATKHDKVRSSKRDRRKRDLAAGCEVEQGEIIWVSAEKNVGLDRLRAIVREALAA